MAAPIKSAERLAPAALAPGIAETLSLPAQAVEAALELLAQGAHPPFIARYRQERTMGWNVEIIERVQNLAARAVAFEFERESLRRQLTERKMLSPELEAELDGALDEAALDDLKHRTRKRKRGGGPKPRPPAIVELATRLWNEGSRGPLAKQSASEPPPEPAALAEPCVTEAEPTVESVLSAAIAVCSEQLSQLATLRAQLRALVRKSGAFVTALVPQKKEKAGKLAALAGRREPISGIPPARFLQIARAEREGILQVDIDVDENAVFEVARKVLGIDSERPCAAALEEAIRTAWHGVLGKAVRAGVRAMAKREADERAIGRYREALRPLLLAPALGPLPILGIDPGFQHGCRLVIVDAAGKLLAHDIVFPLQPKLQAPQAKARIAELCREHAVKAIAVGNGSGGREIERLCRELIRDEEAGLHEVVVAAVDGDAAALYASSRSGKDENAGLDAAVRRGLSLARRLQDPLRELARVDLRKLGLGQHQHEVEQEELRSALDQVLSSCVTLVGVDVNEAPAELLIHVAGLSQALTKAVVAHRDEHGPFRTRAQLLDVPGMPGKAFEQSSGSLRIRGGEQPLDATAIHPERYSQVIMMARDIGMTIADVLGNAEIVDRIAENRDRHLGKPGVSGEPLGELTWRQILDELKHPGRDIRPEFTPATFRPELQAFENLSVGMEVEGIVTHLAPFGVFVDVGISQEGLVHVSELTHEFVSTPFDAVHVGQRVKGRVLEIDPERKRFSISLKALLPRPERPAGEEKKNRKGGRPRRERDRGREGDKGREKGRDDARPSDRERDKGRGGDRGRENRKGGKGGRKREPDRSERPERKDRVLNFRLDLSDLVERLQKG